MVYKRCVIGHLRDSIREYEFYISNTWWHHQMEHFPRHWPHKGQRRRALMVSLICTWKNGWVNNRYTGDVRRHHYDVTVMLFIPMHFFVAKLYTQSVTRVSDNPTAADYFNVQAKWQKLRHACDLLLFLVDVHGSDEKYLNDHATLYINWIYRSTCCWKNIINVISYIFHDPNCSCRGYWTEQLIYRFFLALV